MIFYNILQSNNLGMHLKALNQGILYTNRKAWTTIMKNQKFFLRLQKQPRFFSERTVNILHDTIKHSSTLNVVEIGKKYIINSTLHLPA